ncbi:hypothetical protein P170DRAFT_440667 [Aspergillus steynii IBT 23096]|uniref:RING-type domain-containing protein n=1 Tax=Aspergillus steynii IBT 23096 TaxID=1392250 RepID=A0A2I2FUP1_9EURO|nr:uncharacterized protein P170DRAFT_440667 [Aspergillus steynii IBT 23096]PLB44365.1 hypothetical protein P170DRAFT_440667 [Aspergillus steynii IBT 23096]
MDRHDHVSLLSSDPYETYQYSPDPNNSSPVDSSISSPPRRKRRRLSRLSAENHPPEFDHENHGETEPATSIDLTEPEGPSALSKTLAKQREDAIKAQQGAKNEGGRSLLTAYKCPVCMDTPVDATSTACGHLFCHKCIIDTLKFSEEQRADTSGKTPRGTCPVCRKPLTRNDVPGPRRNLIPLQLKLTTRKRD